MPPKPNTNSDNTPSVTPTTNTAPTATAAVDPSFASYYLQRTTQELSDDLEKVRNADDFKADSVQFLVHALQQGATQFSPESQQHIAAAAAAGAGRDGR